jgi:hypothetical protein
MTERAKCGRLECRYGPNNRFEPQVIAALTNEWASTAAICSKLGRLPDAGPRYILRRLAAVGAIEHKTEPSNRSRTGFSYFFRRKI